MTGPRTPPPAKRAASPSKRRGRPAHDDQLTPAEWRVVEAVRHGLSNRQIAELTGVSVDAVKFHVANVLLKLSLGSRREIRLWDGIARSSARFATAETAMNNDPLLLGLGQVARTVKDIDAARRWYAEVLGLRHLYSFGDLAFFDLGPVRLLLSPHGTPASNSILYFRVADIAAAQEALAARGVAFTHAPHMIHRHADGTEEWLAFFNDPDGAPLGLISAVPAKGDGP
jgi:DNA-binding CsgD family transcriptional regulator/catechol 2,3-dioxygenase-like lactoylglutathione lyase family enzyme